MDLKILKSLIVLGVPGVSLGVFYLLFKKLSFKFSEIPPVLSGIIVITFLCLTAGVTIFALYKWAPKEKLTENQLGLKSDRIIVHTKRNIDDPKHLEFINSLPVARLLAFSGSQPLIDSTVTADVRQGTKDYIDFLKRTWIKLAEFFPAQHFAKSDLSQYLSEYIQARYSHHHANLEPRGSGTGGTIIFPMADGLVIRDLERMIKEIVISISLESDLLDIKKWKEEWSSEA